MSESARIQNIEVLREMKAALLDFAKEAALTITAVDADVQRVGQWLTLERPTYWKHEVRRREEQVEAAKAEIRRKELAAHPNPADTVLERKALKRAKDKLERAEQKRQCVRKWAPAWEREAMIFKGGCSPLNEVLHREIPAAVARLDRMIESLEEYFRLAAPATDSVSAQASGSVESMARSHEQALLHPGDRYGPLRRHIPTPAERTAYEAYEMPRIDWQAGVPNEADAEAISRLDTWGDLPFPAQTVTVSWRSLKDDQVFMVRLPPVEGAERPDSGWYIGPVENPQMPGGTRVCTVGELVQQVPGLATLVALREGSLVVLHRGIVKAILDGGDRDVWGVARAGPQG
ncbi:MAG: hypothetical protein GIKADHBN_02525 [Phycisphaerales bacterium]|nr:hypothetical protein [Phycisphaerales bacterium]